MRNTSLIGCLAIAALAVGCSNAPAPTPDTRTADVQAVKDVDAAVIKVLATKDADKFASYFAEDGCTLYPGAGIVCGRAVIKAAAAPVLADPNYSFTYQSTKMVASKGGDMVYSQGTYTYTLTNPKTKKPMTDKGKYLTVYTKQTDGSWKAVADTMNSDSPM
jgi:uncharacterized protein (TIGR02246 family)